MDIGKDLVAAQGLAGDNHAVGTHNGAAIDMKGFHEALVVLNAGPVGTSGTVDVKVQECDTSGGTYADIAGAAFTQVVAANDEAIYQGRIRITASRKRYIRVVAVVGTAACDFGVAVLKGEAVDLPAATPEFDIHG